MNIHLRHWRPEDADSLVRLANNKKIWDQLRDYFPFPYTHAHAQKWIGSHAGNKNSTHFVITADHKLAGAISLIPREDIYRCSAEIGYWVGEPYWGKGIATAAVKQLLEFTEQRFPHIVRVYAEILASNKASFRVLEKNGFYLESERKNSVIKNQVIGNDTVWVKQINLKNKTSDVRES